MDEKPSPPKKTSRGVYLRGGISSDVYGNRIFGFDEGVTGENTEELRVFENVLIASATPNPAPGPQSPERIRAWYERPLGIIALGVIAAILFAALAATVQQMIGWP